MRPKCDCCQRRPPGQCASEHLVGLGCNKTLLMIIRGWRLRLWKRRVCSTLEACRLVKELHGGVESLHEKYETCQEDVVGVEWGVLTRWTSLTVPRPRPCHEGCRAKGMSERRGS